jgi:hypothetical protein
MNRKLLLVIGSIFLSFCSSDRQEVSSIEFMSYSYFLKNKTDRELRCYRYAYLKEDGSILYYHWKKYNTNEPEYCKSIVGNELLDSILIAEKNQKEENQKKQELVKQGFISMEGGPHMKIKINLCNGTYEVADFRMGDQLSKYLDSIGNKEKLVPINDTVDLINKKLKLINFIWKEDSINHKIIPPPPED